ncbi:MAG: hypothetical protein ACPHS0_16440, partial [bacterium]
RSIQDKNLETSIVFVKYKWWMFHPRPCGKITVEYTLKGMVRKTPSNPHHFSKFSSHLRAKLKAVQRLR